MGQPVGIIFPVWGSAIHTVIRVPVKVTPTVIGVLDAQQRPPTNHLHQGLMHVSLRIPVIPATHAMNYIAALHVMLQPISMLLAVHVTMDAILEGTVAIAVPRAVLRGPLRASMMAR